MRAVAVADRSLAPNYQPTKTCLLMQRPPLSFRMPLVKKMGPPCINSNNLYFFLLKKSKFPPNIILFIG